MGFNYLGFDVHDSRYFVFGAANDVEGRLIWQATILLLDVLLIGVQESSFCQN